MQYQRSLDQINVKKNSAEKKLLLLTLREKLFRKQFLELGHREKYFQGIIKRHFDHRRVKINEEMAAISFITRLPSRLKVGVESRQSGDIVQGPSFNKTPMC